MAGTNITCRPLLAVQGEAQTGIAGTKIGTLHGLVCAATIAALGRPLASCLPTRIVVIWWSSKLRGGLSTYLADQLGNCRTHVCRPRATAPPHGSNKERATNKCTAHPDRRIIRSPARSHTRARLDMAHLPSKRPRMWSFTRAASDNAARGWLEGAIQEARAVRQQ